MIDYDKYIYSKGTHYISNSGGDERGKITGGKAGDQTGKEWQLKAWYSRPWTHVFRHPDPEVRRLIAELAIEGALNNNIGYDQYQRTTFWTQLKQNGYRPANIKTKCEEDCSAGVNSIVKAVGYLTGNKKLQAVSSANTSRNTKSALINAGFKCLTESKYLKQSAYLLPGDVLLYENHHVATNVTYGKKATGDVGSGETNPPKLCKGDKGDWVTKLQRYLIEAGYWLEVNGEFGDTTEVSVNDFKTKHGLEPNGVCGSKMWKLLQENYKLPEPKPEFVRVTGESVNVRSVSNTDSEVLGIVKKGDVLPYIATEPNGWFHIKYESQEGYISDKYSEIV